VKLNLISLLYVRSNDGSKVKFQPRIEVSITCCLVTNMAQLKGENRHCLLVEH